MAVVDVDGSAFCGVPGEDDGARRPGFAETEDRFVRVVVWRATGIRKGAWVDNDVVEPRVSFVFAADCEEACLSGNGDSDFVSDLDSALPFETDFGEEEFDICLQAFAEAGREFGYEGNVFEKDGVPGLGEVGGDDFPLYSSMAACEEVLPAEEEGGDSEEDEEEDVGRVNGREW